jgi:hypothetical protein
MQPASREQTVDRDGAGPELISGSNCSSERDKHKGDPPYAPSHGGGLQMFHSLKEGRCEGGEAYTMSTRRWIGGRTPDFALAKGLIRGLTCCPNPMPKILVYYPL